jgi:hypothetical protein
MIRDFSQQGEAKWVLDTLDYKKDGTFVDIGCATPFYLNNTAVLEMEYGWKGIAVDREAHSGVYHDPINCPGKYPQDILDNPHLQTWNTRDRTRVYETDALVCNYEKMFEESDMPEIIDFLNVDLHPPDVTLNAFRALPHHKYKFRSIIFETDAYTMPISGRLEFTTPDEWLSITRKIISSYGYEFVKQDGQNDMYVLGKKGD